MLKKILIIIFTIIVSVSFGYFYGYSKGIKVAGKACKYSLSLLASEITVLDGNHLNSLNKANNYYLLLESVLEHKLKVLETLEKHLAVFLDNKTILKDKAFLYLRLGLLHEDNQEIELSNKEFDKAVALYNSTQESKIKLDDLKEIYKELQGSE